MDFRRHGIQAGVGIHVKCKISARSTDASKNIASSGQVQEAIARLVHHCKGSLVAECS